MLGTPANESLNLTPSACIGTRYVAENSSYAPPGDQKDLSHWAKFQSAATTETKPTAWRTEAIQNGGMGDMISPAS